MLYIEYRFRATGVVGVGTGIACLVLTHDREGEGWPFANLLPVWADRFSRQRPGVRQSSAALCVWDVGKVGALESGGGRHTPRRWREGWGWSLREDCHLSRTNASDLVGGSCSSNRVGPPASRVVAVRDGGLTPASARFAGHRFAPRHGRDMGGTPSGCAVLPVLFSRPENFLAQNQNNPCEKNHVPAISPLSD